MTAKIPINENKMFVALTTLGLGQTTVLDVVIHLQSSRAFYNSLTLNLFKFSAVKIRERAKAFSLTANKHCKREIERKSVICSLQLWVTLD